MLENCPDGTVTAKNAPATPFSYSRNISCVSLYTAFSENASKNQKKQKTC